MKEVGFASEEADGQEAEIDPEFLVVEKLFFEVGKDERLFADFEGPLWNDARFLFAGEIYGKGFLQSVAGRPSVDARLARIAEKGLAAGDTQIDFLAIGFGDGD